MKPKKIGGCGPGEDRGEHSAGRAPVGREVEGYHTFVLSGGNHQRCPLDSHLSMTHDPTLRAWLASTLPPDLFTNW